METKLAEQEIQEYNKISYLGKLNFSDENVKKVAQKCMKLFINAPVPHFMSTFIYFYKDMEYQENPVTCSAFKEEITVHPGQGRLIASYVRGSKFIEALLVPLHETDEEIKFLRTISSKMSRNYEQLYHYHSSNHIGISTVRFKEYFYPTKTRLRYEREKQKLLDKHLNQFYPLQFLFSDHKPIIVGKGYDKRLTQVFCKNPQGVFDFIADASDKKLFRSINYEVKAL